MGEGFEQAVANTMLKPKSEKTYIDKMLSKQDIDSTKEVFKKDDLTREELLELLHSCVNSEMQLKNFSKWERQIVLKLYVWIGEFSKLAQMMFDIKDQIKTNFHHYTPECHNLMNQCSRMMEHITKYMISFYHNITRTSLSIQATAFTELLHNKFEMVYDDPRMRAMMDMNKQTQHDKARVGKNE